jgi:hypothetical protein
VPEQAAAFYHLPPEAKLEAIAKGQMTGQLDKANEIAAPSATVTVKEIFAGVDIKGRAGVRVQGTESDELGAVSGRPSDPILLPEIIEQRKVLFQFFDVLATAQFASEGEGRRRPPEFPGKDGGPGEIFQRRKGQRICRTGVSKDKSPAW